LFVGCMRNRKMLTFGTAPLLWCVEWSVPLWCDE
jgi:hypothetical protein